MSRDGSTIKLLGMSGSLRKRSFNTALLQCCLELLPDGVTLEIFDLATIPHYNHDIEMQLGFPKPVVALRDAIADAHAVIMATPEYNYSIPGVLKNAIDWASRRADAPKSVLYGKPLGMITATPGRSGGVHAQKHLYDIAVGVGMIPLERPVAQISGVREKIDDNRVITDDATRRLLVDFLVALADLTRAYQIG
jgi:chromate reductase